MPSALPADFSAYLSHEEAGVRGRSWAWQSALGLQLVDGHQPSPYLVETACRHIEGQVSLELVVKLVDSYYLTHPGSLTEEVDRRLLELVRMLGATCELSRRGAPPSADKEMPILDSKVVAPAPPQAYESAAGLHLRQKRLLRTLGTQVLSVPELLHALRLSTRQSFMRVWLTPAMDSGLVKALHPESPRHPQQKYLLTRRGQRFLKQLVRK